MKAILIDAKNRDIRAVEIATFTDINKMLDIGRSPFCFGWSWPTGDVLFVDDEGLLKSTQHFFWLADRLDQPFAGNGLVMGGDDPEDADHTLDPTITLEQLRATVRFADRDAAVEWARANPDALAIRLMSFGADGVASVDIHPIMPDAFPETTKPAT